MNVETNFLAYTDLEVEAEVSFFPASKWLSNKSKNHWGKSNKSKMVLNGQSDNSNCMHFMFLSVI